MTIYIAVGVLLVLGLLLFSPITIYFEYYQGMKVKIRFFLFVWDPLKPQKEKPLKGKKGEKSQKENKNKNKNKSENKEKPKFSMNNFEFNQLISLAAKLFDGLKRPLKKFLKGIKLKDVSLEISVGSEDAAKTAISYGGISGSVYGILALADDVFTVKCKQIAVYPDYLQENTRIYLKAVIKINIFLALLFLLSVAKNDLKLLMDFIHPKNKYKNK